MLRIALIVILLFGLPLFCLAQYEGQVVVTYDGPSQFAPAYAGGGSAGGYAGYAGGSAGGNAGYAGGSAGGQPAQYGYYQQPQMMYTAQPRYYGRPVYGGGGWGGRNRGGWGGGGFGAGVGFNVGGFGAGIGAGFNGGGGGGRQIVCGPNGCFYQ